MYKKVARMPSDLPDQLGAALDALSAIDQGLPGVSCMHTISSLYLKYTSSVLQWSKVKTEASIVYTLLVNPIAEELCQTELTAP